MTTSRDAQSTEPLDARTCQQVTALLADYVAGALDSATTQALEHHLRAYRDCVAFLNTYQATYGAIRALRYEEMPAVLQEEMLTFLRHKLQGTPPAP